MTAVPTPSTPPEIGPDQHGRARMITVLTPLKPFGVLRSRLSFLATRLFPGLVHIGPLDSVYFTRWSLLRKIPYNGPPQVRDRLASPYLVWESDWTGVMEPYIEAFVYAVGPQINRTWATSYGFPGTGSVTALREYIEHLSHPGGYSYCAYPAASVRMVRSALAVEREHRFLEQAARTSSAADFAVVYRGFLRRRQEDL